MKIGMAEPFPGKYDANDPYGNIGDRDPNGPGHLGSDWVVPAGSLAPAICRGTIMNKGIDSGNGGYLTLSIGAPGVDTGLYAGYIHSGATGTSGTTPGIPVGTVVKQGDLIFVTGDAGSNSHGAHLHITISDSPQAWAGVGNKRDPYAYITGNLGPDASPGNVWLDENGLLQRIPEGSGGNLYMSPSGLLLRSEDEGNVWLDADSGLLQYVMAA